MKLETKEEYLVDSAIEMLYPTVTFNSYEAAVKHIPRDAGHVANHKNLSHPTSRRGSHGGRR